MTRSLIVFCRLGWHRHTTITRPPSADGFREHCRSCGATRRLRFDGTTVHQTHWTPDPQENP